VVLSRWPIWQKVGGGDKGGGGSKSDLRRVEAKFISGAKLKNERCGKPMDHGSGGGRTQAKTGVTTQRHQ